MTGGAGVPAGVRRYCEACGAELSPDAAFCAACGAPAPGSAPRPHPPPAPHGYGQQPPSVPIVQKTNGFAVASLVLGIVWIYWIGSILALIFGYVAKSQIDSSQGRQGGRGMAIAGIVLGWVGVGILTLVIVLAIVGASSAPGPP